MEIILIPLWLICSVLVAAMADNRGQSGIVAFLVAFISALESDVQNCTSVKTSKGGKNQGTYAVELVAMKYAGWIDPS